MARKHANPCELCTGACCQELAVLVNILDIARIQRALQIPVRDFVVRYIDEDPREKPFVFPLRGQPVALALRPPAGRSSGCSFLMQIGPHRRCGIYEIRPTICRIYPFTENKGRIQHKRGVLCPRRFDMQRLGPEAIRREIRRYQREWQKHAEFVEEWAQRPPKYPSFAKLLDFVERIIAEGRV